MANRISPSERCISLLAVSFGSIGDGQLPNAGLERLLEAYCRVSVFGRAHIALDHQPAAGSVLIFALQLHQTY